MSPRPGGPEIAATDPSRRRRDVRPTTAVLAAAIAFGVALALPAPSAGQDAPDPAVPSAEAPAAPAADGLAPAPVRVRAAAGAYSAPTWLPLRRDLEGDEVTVGCTYNSRGSAHGYECGGHHSRWALDFPATPGTAVFAAGAGFATDLTGQPGGSGFGRVVAIDHGFGTTTIYAHLRDVAIPPEGAWVDETTLIGAVGSTGSSSTPHLHFERLQGEIGSEVYDRTSVDPGPLLACRGDQLVAFPAVAGHASWEGLPWGAMTVASDGQDCAADQAERQLADLVAQLRRS